MWILSTTTDFPTPESGAQYPLSMSVLSKIIVIIVYSPSPSFKLSHLPRSPVSFYSRIFRNQDIDTGYFHCRYNALSKDGARKYM